MPRGGCLLWAAPWVQRQELGASLVQERREAAGLSAFLLSECSLQPSRCERLGRSSCHLCETRHPGLSQAAPTQEISLDFHLLRISSSRAPSSLQHRGPAALLVELRDLGRDTMWKGAHKPGSSLSTALPVGEKGQEGQLGVAVGRALLCPWLQELAANLMGWKWSGSK